MLSNWERFAKRASFSSISPSRMALELKTCEYCEKSFPANKTGRPRRFCKIACSRAAKLRAAKGQNDPLAEKRERLAALMRSAGKDSPTLEHDIASLPPEHLDYLIDHYSAPIRVG